MEIQIVAVTLVAVLVGALVPVLIQLRRTLRAVEVLIETTGPILTGTLEETSNAAAKIRAVADRIESGAGALNGLAETAGGLLHLLGRARASIRSRRSTRRNQESSSMAVPPSTS